MSGLHHPFRRQYSCHCCDYDMDECVSGDLCPECGTPLDVRPNDTHASRTSRIALAMVIGALITLIPIGTLSVLFVLIGNYLNARTQPQSTSLRLSYHTRNRKSLIRTLSFFWIAEFLIVMFIGLYWPGIFNWW